jgi:hypothetical protein
MSTPRYADYGNTNGGITQFTDNWVDGAKYQQLKGTGSLSNESFNSQFAAAKGGAATKTMADDGDGWKLIKQDKGEKSNERKLEYKDLAAQWQAAGYDVRVQDHNPDFEGGTGEIAVRVASPDKDPETPAPVDEGPIEYSPEIMQAKERVKTYEDNILSGKTSRDIYGNDQAFKDGYKLNLKNMNQGFLDKYQFNPEAPAAGPQDSGIKPTKYQPDTFSGSDISPYDTKDSKDRATESFLDEQKRKVIKQANITPYQ